MSQTLVKLFSFDPIAWFQPSCSIDSGANLMQEVVVMDTAGERFARLDAVSQASFYKSRQRLRENNPANQATKLIKPPQFIPVTLPNPLASSPTKMTIELPGGIRVRLEIPGNTSQPSQTETQSCPI